MTNWKKYKLIDVCSKIGSGATPKGGDSSYKESGISLIRSQNILDFTFSNGGLAFIDNKQANELANVEVKERDVLINITGDSVARVCQVPENILPARVNQHVAILRANQSKIDSEFLKYSLLLKQNKDMLLTLASTGATRKALTKGMLENFELFAPENIKDQRKISKVLSTLDEKIELNRQMNQTLEQMAQALFKKYFIDDIDPDNLPYGWKKSKLGEIVEITSSKRIFLNEYVSMGVPFYRSKEIIELHKSGIIRNELFISHDRFEEIKKKFGVPKEGDILITSVGTIGVPYLVNKKDCFYFKDGNLTWIYEYHSYVSPYYLYQWLISEDAQFKIDNIKIGSTQQAITIQALKSIEFLIPPKILHDNLNKQFEDIRKKIEANISETRTLIAIRDMLLPKLMSGEIDVSTINQNEPLHEPVLG